MRIQTKEQNMKKSGNTILITGGGSGIGRELARRLHSLGNAVIVAGRRVDALRETIGTRDSMDALTFDAQDAESIKRLAVEVIKRHPQTNVLINNAGVMRWEDLTGSDHIIDTEEIVATNLLGPIQLTSALISHLKTQPNAAVINISSGLAFVPLPKAPTYSATKAAIHSYTVSLREQLRGQVEVIEIVPPAVQTELTPGQLTREGYMPLSDFIEETIALLATEPTPAEILVERVKLLRNAEAEGRYGDVLKILVNH
jgi:uncharacterized oxidoreductase